MSYTCALSLKKIKDYLAGAAVVGFDFETSPIEEYRSEERAALDAHKAAITGYVYKRQCVDRAAIPLCCRSIVLLPFCLCWFCLQAL